MQGIAKFHRSTQGKRLHRNLARTLATRITHGNNGTSLSLRPDRATAREMLKTISSYSTHILIESDWASQPELSESLDQYVFEQYAIPCILGIEKKLLGWCEDYDIEKEELSEDEIELLLRLCPQNERRKAFNDTDAILAESFPSYFDTYGITQAVQKAIKGVKS